MQKGMQNIQQNLEEQLNGVHSQIEEDILAMEAKFDERVNQSLEESPLIGQLIEKLQKIETIQKRQSSACCQSSQLKKKFDDKSDAMQKRLEAQESVIQNMQIQMETMRIESNNQFEGLTQEKLKLRDTVDLEVSGLKKVVKEGHIDLKKRIESKYGDIKQSQMEESEALRRKIGENTEDLLMRIENLEDQSKEAPVVLPHKSDIETHMKSYEDQFQMMREKIESLAMNDNMIEDLCIKCEKVEQIFVNEQAMQQELEELKCYISESQEELQDVQQAIDSLQRNSQMGDRTDRE